MRSKFTKFVAALTIGLLATQDAMACSRVLWASPDGQVLVGRTQDWTEKAGHAFRVFPRGIERVGAVNENPHNWTSKYGSLVLTAYDAATHEGVNEEGLSGHILYLAEEAAFGERDASQEAISVMEWLQYYLDNFATVAEAVEATEVDRLPDRAADPAERLPDACPHVALGQVGRFRGDRIQGRQAADLSRPALSP